MTPTTVLVAGDGRVEQVWTGKWMSQDLKVAGSRLGVDFVDN